MTDNKNFIEGFALSGLEVLGAKDKTFEIIGLPSYHEFQDGDKAKRKLKMNIKFMGAEVEYFPNRTSQIKIIQAKGRGMTEWVGFKGEFFTELQLVGKEKFEVIYIK